MAKVIAVANQKGGVAKTTTTVNLAAALAELGHKVLVVDLDAQANATRWLGSDTDRGLLDLFSEEMPLENLARPTPVPGVSLIPASPGLGHVDRALAGEAGLEAVLRNAVDKLPDEWDYLVLDCPPALGLMTVSGLNAARWVLIPCETRAMALQGLGSLLNTIDQVKTRLRNEKLAILGIVPCRVTHTVLSREIIEGLKQRFGDLVTKTSVRESIRLAEAPSHKLAITTYDPAGAGAEDYRALALELKEKTNGQP